MIPTLISFPGQSSNAIANTQSITATAGGGLILNGTLAPIGNLTPSATTIGAVGAYDQSIILPGIARPLTVTASTSATAVVFTFVGYNLQGTLITATIIGASGGGTTATDNTATTSGVDFHIVTGVKASASIAGITIGTGATGVTNWLISDLYKTPFSMTVGGEVSATTTTYTIQDTPDNVAATAAPTVFNNPTINAIATTSAQAVYSAPVRAVRGSVSTNTATGGVTFFFIQAGGP